MALDLGDLVAEPMDLLADSPSVGFELTLAGSAGPDSAGGTRQVGPHPGQARQVVLELGELDLEPPLAGAGVAGEDVEDQGAAVEDLAVGDLLEVPLLVRAQLVVDDEEA